MNVLAMSAAIALSLMAGTAAAQPAAQPVIKSTMPDGKVVYGEKPAPGAAKVEKIEPPPAKSGITVVTPEEKARLEQLTKERTGKPAVEGPKANPLDEARKQLKQAEEALEAGKEPRPGERLGTVGGKSRLTDDYFKRIQGLEQAVADARKRVEALEKGR